MLPLFDEPPSFDRAALAARLRALAAENIFVGASSWKYEGWLAQIYAPERYLALGLEVLPQSAFESGMPG